MKLSERQRTLLFAIAIWAALSLVDALVLRAEAGGGLLRALRYRAVDYGILAALGIVVWHVCARWRRAAVPAVHQALLHVVLAVAVLLGWQLGHSLYLYVCGGGGVLANLLAKSPWLWLQAGLLYALMVIGILYAQARGRLRRQAERQAQLELLAREAELRALRSQLRPHFLFNVLNSIYAFIGEAPEKAERMVALLADLLRETLELGDQELVSLDRELALARRYLAIESVRLGDRLAVDVQVEDGLGEVAIPPFLLQPLVENAIQHGIAPSAEGGRLTIDARRVTEDTIEVRVQDTGAGEIRNRGRQTLGGRGLAITKGRLAASYADAATLTVEPRDDRGWAAVVRVPTHPEARPA